MIQWRKANKWQKYLTLLKDSNIRPYLPETQILNINRLKDFLDRYPSVYLKPIVGTGGYGIIKVTKMRNAYLLQTYQFNINYANIATLYQGVEKITRGRKYMIQQGISLISIAHRPIDFRVLVLKPQSRWELMGIMGKLGAKNKIVTNHSRGGKAILLPKAFKDSLHLADKDIKGLEAKLKKISLDVAVQLSRDYEYVREIGIDIGVDDQLRPWIFETNSMPRFNLFRSHPDKTLYPKIRAYIAQIRKNYRAKK